MDYRKRKAAMQKSHIHTHIFIHTNVRTHRKYKIICILCMRIYVYVCVWLLLLLLFHILKDNNLLQHCQRWHVPNDDNKMSTALHKWMQWSKEATHTCIHTYVHIHTSKQLDTDYTLRKGYFFDIWFSRGNTSHII